MSSSKPAPPETTKNGSCLCKKVQYTVTGQDRGAVVCHCVNCQKGTGSAFAHNHQITKAQLEVKSGKDFVKTFEDRDTKSGNSLSRSFCSNCGGGLFLSTSQTPGLIVVMNGSIDGQKMAPKREFFKENREGWVGEVVAKL